MNGVGGVISENTSANGEAFQRMQTLDELGSGRASHAFGIQGYKMPKAGLPPRNPKYSVPKDKLQNFLEQVKKRAKTIPGPP